MKDPPPDAVLFLLQNPQRFLVGFPVMNDDRQVQFFSQAQEFPEAAQLHLAGRMIAVKIQADLAKGHDFFLLPGQPPHFLVVPRLNVLHFMGVNA